MQTPTQFLIEGLDRVGKDTLVGGLEDRLGYHLVVHYRKPKVLAAYSGLTKHEAERQYQIDGFRALFELLTSAPAARLICNRAHLGECVYAPVYRGYSGDYVFDLEKEYAAAAASHVRQVLLVEDLERSRHFVDDGKSLGDASKRKLEQELFLDAFARSVFVDKRVVSVTDPQSGMFRPPAAILNEVMR